MSLQRQTDTVVLLLTWPEHVMTERLKSCVEVQCISHMDSLHEDITGSIVHLNMFCILWMLCCFACPPPASDNVPFVCCWATDFSLHHFKGGFCRLFLNVKGKQKHTPSSCFILPFYCAVHSCGRRCLSGASAGCFIEHILCGIFGWFAFTGNRLSLRSNQRFTLINLCFFPKRWARQKSPEWIFPVCSKPSFKSGNLTVVFELFFLILEYLFRLIVVEPQLSFVKDVFMRWITQRVSP